MDVTISQILPGLIHLNFTTRIEMNKSLMRFQEYAENPKYKNVRQSTSRLKKYYKNFKTNYYKEILGCNIPQYCFLAYEYDPLNKYEKEILAKLNKYCSDNHIKEYYVIASADTDINHEDEKALEHEICHGLFALNPMYKAEVTLLLKLHPYYDAFKKQLRVKYKYHEDVLEDEANAFITTDSENTLKDRFSNLSKAQIDFTINKLRKQLVEIYNKYTANYDLK